MNKIYSRIDTISGDIIKVKASGVAYKDLARVKTRSGLVSLAEVIQINGDWVSLQIFIGTQGISTGDSVEFLGAPMKISASPYLLGRVFDGSGQPIDGKPPITEEMVNIGGPSFNPARRIIPKHMIRTGVPMIDLFNTLVQSQKLPIFSVSGEPYNELLARIALQAEVDVIIVGGISLKYDDYLKFRDTLQQGGALSRTVMFMHTASDPVVEALMIPDFSLAVAEQYAITGKNVLVLLSDMTNFADALKEIAIAQDQVPSNRGYPGSLYSELASRYEKAVDIEGSGSITILAVTTMPGDDVTHPVPDNTGYITEGQFYLKGGRIEPFGSLSRLKQQVNGHTRDDHRSMMDVLIKLYAQYKSTLEKQAMGFTMTDWDEKLMTFGGLFEEKFMDLSVNISLEDGLDLGWQLLGQCFNPEETGMKKSLIDKYWKQVS